MSLPLRLAQASPLDYFAVLVGSDEQFPLLEAAASLAQDEDPTLDLSAVLTEVDALAGRLQARLPIDAPAVHRLRVLNRYFFHELGFAGNRNDYHDPANSFVHAVLATRRGIPISLAVLYLEIAQQMGLVVHGVSFPGHFLVKVSLPTGEVVIDPFSGESLSRERLDERLEPFRRQQGLVGDFEAPLGLFLQAASPRDIVARMLRNLRAIYQEAQDLSRQLRIQQRLVCLLPQDPQERRDRGLLWLALGHVAAAQADLQYYLRCSPESPDAAHIQAQLAALPDASPGQE